MRRAALVAAAVLVAGLVPGLSARGQSQQPPRPGPNDLQAALDAAHRDELVGETARPEPRDPRAQVVEPAQAGAVPARRHHEGERHRGDP